MSKIKKFAGQTAIYGISTIVGRAVNFLLVPLYTTKTVMSVAQYGSVTELYAYVAFFNIIFQFGMETTYFRWANKVEEKIAYNNSMSFVIVISTVLSGILIALASQITNVLNAPIFLEFITNIPDYISDPNKKVFFYQPYFIYFLALVIAIDAIVAIPFARLRHTKKSKKFAIIRLINIGINIGLNLFFLLLCKPIHEGTFLPSLKSTIDLFYIPNFEVGYVFLSNLIANALFIPLLYKEFLAFKFQLAKEYLKPMLKFTLPLVLVGMAGMINETIDRVLLKYLLPNGFDGKSSQDMVGIYGAAYKLSIFMSLIIQAFRYAAEPFFFSQAKDKKSPELFAKIMKWFVIACVFIFLGVSLERHFIGTLFLRNSEYLKGLVVVPILLLANLFLGIYYNQSIWYKLTDKTRYGSIISIIGALITFAFNIALIPYFGYLGSAITTLVCYFSMSVISYIWGQKHYPIPYDLKSAFFYIITSCAIVASTYFITFDNFWIRFIVMGLVFGAFVAMTIFIERKNLKSILRPKKA